MIAINIINTTTMIAMNIINTTAMIAIATPSLKETGTLLFLDKTSPSIFRPVLSRGETVDSCCSQCSDDVRWSIQHHIQFFSLFIASANPSRSLVYKGSCWSPCSDDVRWCQLLADVKCFSPAENKKIRKSLLEPFSANLKFHKAPTKLFTKKANLSGKLVYLYINPSSVWFGPLSHELCKSITKINI